MKTWWAVAFGIAGGLLASGLILLASSPPRGEPVQLLPPPTPAPLIVYVAGAVQYPGVYSLPLNSRIQDALKAAGGPLVEADLQPINLAAFLDDGDRIEIPTIRPTELVSERVDNPVTTSPSTQSSSSTRFVNINSASQEELESLPGIGPVTAQKIIAYRQTQGPFASIEEIQNVSGIGPVTFGRIKDLIMVGSTP
jgi:competence protein ComEA